MDKRDNLNGDGLIRQKLAGLDTPPPQTSWLPGQSWEKLQNRLASEKPAAFRPLPWYYAAAAALFILLLPFAVMLTDIRRQEAQIDQLSARLEKNNGQPAASERVAGGKTPVKPEPVRAGEEPASAEEKHTVKRVPRITPAGTPPQRKLPVAEKTVLPDALFARQPVAHPEEKMPEEKAENRMLQAETPSTGQAHIVISRAKRKTTSVTVHFPGSDSGRSEGRLAGESPNQPHKKTFRVFARRPDWEGSQPAPSGPVVSVLSARIK